MRVCISFGRSIRVGLGLKHVEIPTRKCAFLLLSMGSPEECGLASMLTPRYVLQASGKFLYASRSLSPLPGPARFVVISTCKVSQSIHRHTLRLESFRETRSYGWRTETWSSLQGLQHFVSTPASFPVIPKSFGVCLMPPHLLFPPHQTSSTDNLLSTLQTRPTISNSC